MASYKLKQIKFNGRETMVVMQNENGPCPLLAIANVLLLRGVLVIPSNSLSVSEDRLMQMVAEYLLDNNKVEDNSPNAANLRKNLEDVLSVLPKLATGVDVNPSFDSVRGFEFTDEIAIFDLFGVGLVHGWVMDPQSENKDLRAFTYNQLVVKLVAILGSETPAHLLTTHSSITSKLGSMKKENSVDAFDSEAPLIELDSADLGSASGTINSGEAKASKENQLMESSSQDGAVVVKNTVDDILNRVEASFREKENSSSPLVSDQVQARSEKQSGVSPTERDDLGCVSAAASSGKQDTEDFSRRAQEWLQNTSSQLTPFGLFCLLQDVKNEQLVVFFRNNHFNTIYKKEDCLYLLVTDQGYLSEPNVVWEKLDAVDGDTQMMTDGFSVFGRPEYVDTDLVDLDLQKALSASMAKSQLENDDGGQTFDSNVYALPDNFLVSGTLQSPVPSSDADLALAMQLQEEEEREEAARLSRVTAARVQSQHTGRHRSDRIPHPPPNRAAPTQHPQHQSSDQKSFFQKVSESFKDLFGSKK